MDVIHIDVCRVFKIVVWVIKNKFCSRLRDKVKHRNNTKNKKAKLNLR